MGYRQVYRQMKNNMHHHSLTVLTILTILSVLLRVATKNTHTQVQYARVSRILHEGTINME